MQQTSTISGFSDLKDLLIRTYKIDKPRENIRLYFTESKDQILLHDYHDHKKSIILITRILNKEIADALTINASKLCIEALSHEKPAYFLNESFILYGFFRT